jgi:hypothetical protein
VIQGDITLDSAVGSHKEAQKTQKQQDAWNRSVTKQVKQAHSATPFPLVTYVPFRG